MKSHYRYRSAITGKYVSAAFAKRNPRTTIRERVASRAFDQFVKGESPSLKERGNGMPVVR